MSKQSNVQNKHTQFQRLMLNEPLKPGYNVQIGVEAEYIVGMDIFSERNDLNTLVSFMDKVTFLYLVINLLFLIFYSFLLILASCAYLAFFLLFVTAPYLKLVAHFLQVSLTVPPLRRHLDHISFGTPLCLAAYIAPPDPCSRLSDKTKSIRQVSYMSLNVILSITPLILKFFHG